MENHREIAKDLLNFSKLAGVCRGNQKIHAGEVYRLLRTADYRLPTNLAAGGDREVNRPGGIGGNERSRLADGSKV
jgi:hypothetical protein